MRLQIYASVQVSKEPKTKIDAFLMSAKVAPARWPGRKKLNKGPCSRDNSDERRKERPGDAPKAAQVGKGRIKNQRAKGKTGPDEQNAA